MEKGIIAALVSPLTEDERIDVESLERLINRVIDAGCVGVFIGGTIGEGAALLEEEVLVLYRETSRLVGGRVPVLANASESGTKRSCRLAELAEKAGVDAVVVTPRYYFPQRTPEETVTHVKLVSERVSIPVWFYENPHTTMVHSTFEQIKRLVDLHLISGVKFSSNDRDLYIRLAKELPPDIPVLTGNTNEIALAGELDTQGSVSGIGSLTPGLCREIYEAAKRREAFLADQLQADLVSIYDIYDGEGWPLWPSAQKYVLQRLGVLNTCVSAAPFVRLGPDEIKRIDAALDNIDWALFR